MRRQKIIIMIKTKLLILIIFFLCSTCAFGQQLKWPYLNSAYARAYMYNLESNLKGGYAIIQDGKINGTVTSKGKKLSGEQTNKTMALINSNIKGLNEGLSKTFIPHHAIVFFNKNDAPKAAIMFDFAGEAIRLQPEKKERKLVLELSEKEINDQLEKLAEFRKIIENTGYPVLNSPFEYQKLKTIKTRELPLPKNKSKDRYSIKQGISVDDNRFDMIGMVRSAHSR